MSLRSHFHFHFHYCNFHAYNVIAKCHMLLQLQILETSNFTPSFSATETQEEEVEFTDHPKLTESSKFVKDPNLAQSNDVQQLMRAEDLVLNID